MKGPWTPCGDMELRAPQGQPVPGPGAPEPLFPRPWPALGPALAQAPRPGMGAAHCALWVGTRTWLETDASPACSLAAAPRPATSLLPPQRQEAARTLFL